MRKYFMKELLQEL